MLNTLLSLPKACSEVTRRTKHGVPGEKCRVRSLTRPHFLSHFELHPAECVSAENNRQPEQDDCDRHERRPGDISEQDKEDRDDGEDGCDVVVHSFPIMGLSTLPCEVIWSKILEQKHRPKVAVIRRRDGRR